MPRVLFWGWASASWTGGQPFALAYNLANSLRTLALLDAVAQWSLTTLREKLVKIGAAAM